MPAIKTTKNGKPAYKYGKTGKAFTYKPGNKKSRAQAKRKAYKSSRRSRRGR